MERIDLAKASSLTSPNPLALICTRKPDGSANLAAVSWWTYVSFRPGMIAFAMSGKSFTGETVRKSGEAVLTIPGAALRDAVLVCGSCSGRDTDKAAKAGIELRDIPGSGIRIPLHTRVAIRCALKEYHEVGDHYLYVCSAEEVFGDEREEALFAWNGYSRIAPALRGE